MVVLHHFGVCREELVVRPPADEGVVVMSRLRVVLDKAYGHVASVEHRLVQSLEGPEPVGGRGAPEPFDPGWRV